MTNDYKIRYSDFSVKGSITVPQQTIDETTTSLSLVGRNSSGFGEKLAENFLHLLENFAGPTPPSNPIEGQLWYDTSDPNKKILRINDSSSSAANWYPASSIHVQDGPVGPTNANIGDIWVDSSAYIMYVADSTSQWLPIGPSFSQTNRTGAYPTNIIDRNGIYHDVLLMYINDVVIQIIAKEAFTPLNIIDGFSNLVPGANISSKLLDGAVPKLNGVSDSALSLKQTSPSVEVVSANNFVRNDVDQSINGAIAINNDSGIKIGKTTSTFSLQRSRSDAVLTNFADGGSFIFNSYYRGVSSSLLTMQGDTKFIGINNPKPGYELDVNGNAQISGKLKINSIDNRALQMLGGIEVGNAAFNGVVTINSSTFVNGVITSQNIIPAANRVYSIGTSTNKFATIYAGEVLADRFTGSLYGSATQLAVKTRFEFTGDVKTVNAVPFNGNAAIEPTVYFRTQLTGASIEGQTSTTAVSLVDTMLIYSQSLAALRKVKKSDFLSDLYAVTPKTGMIIQYAGNDVPTGWLYCDGHSYPKYGPLNALYLVIGDTYGTPSESEFNVPNIPAIYTTSTGAVSSGALQAPVRYLIKI